MSPGYPRSRRRAATRGRDRDPRTPNTENHATRHPTRNRRSRRTAARAHRPPLALAQRGGDGRPAVRLPRRTGRRTRAAPQQRLGPCRRVRPHASDAAAQFAPRHRPSGGRIHARPARSRHRGRPALRAGEQRRRGLGRLPHGDIPRLAATAASVQPCAGTLGRGGVHGRAWHAGAAAGARTHRHGARGRTHRHAGGHRRAGTGRTRLHGPRPQRPCGARRGGQRPLHRAGRHRPAAHAVLRALLGAARSRGHRRDAD